MSNHQRYIRFVSPNTTKEKDKKNNDQTIGENISQEYKGIVKLSSSKHDENVPLIGPQLPKTDCQLRCDICNVIITEIDQAAHDSTITHQFNLNRQSNIDDDEHKLIKVKACSTGNYRHVDQQSKGYQLMMKEGWNGSTGLGANENGRPYPISVRIKSDRAGIGLPQRGRIVASTKSTIDDRSTINCPKKKLKKEILKQSERERQIAINFRQSFNTE
ncbi:G patch domain and ankyrin repeat-containing protein 1 [Blomia tropicalis]|nr:G patch domain and ankyrin repeat-containing protein 1 [Blomia tropicalis]